MVTTLAMNATSCPKIVSVVSTTSSCISILNFLMLFSAWTRGMCSMLLAWIHGISHSNRLSAIIFVVFTSPLDQAALRFRRWYRLASPWSWLIRCSLRRLYQVWAHRISLIVNYNPHWLFLKTWAQQPRHAIFIHDPCVFFEACSFILWTSGFLDRWSLATHLIDLGGNW